MSTSLGSIFFGIGVFLLVVVLLAGLISYFQVERNPKGARTVLIIALITMIVALVALTVSFLILLRASRVASAISTPAAAVPAIPAAVPATPAAAVPIIPKPAAAPTAGAAGGSKTTQLAQLIAQNPQLMTSLMSFL